MYTSPEDFEIVKKMIEEGIPTYDIQEYFSKKYNIKHSASANYIKKVRKQLGVYNYQNKKGKSNDAE